jgi:gas vesicle protein
MNARRILGIAAAVAAGVAAGAALGILYAPDKGTSTRKQIVKKGEEIAGNIRKKVENARMGMNKNFSETPQQEVHEVNTML